LEVFRTKSGQGPPLKGRGGCHSRFSEGIGLVTSKDLYQAIIDVNIAKIENGDLAEDEKVIRESEVERLSLLIKEISK